MFPGMPDANTDAPDLSSIPVRVLVVDDDEGHAQAVAESLQRINCDCKVAGSGEVGSRMIANELFDVVVTDLMMGEIDGLEILKQTKEDLPDAEVISWITLNAAKAMGIDEMTGSLEPGKMADVVLWNGDPLSVYSRPERVWVDGALLYDANDRRRRPVSDFELGQPGEGDVK